MGVWTDRASHGSFALFLPWARRSLPGAGGRSVSACVGVAWGSIHSVKWSGGRVQKSIHPHRHTPPTHTSTHPHRHTYLVRDPADQHDLDAQQRHERHVVQRPLERRRPDDVPRDVQHHDGAAGFFFFNSVV